MRSVQFGFFFLSFLFLSFSIGIFLDRHEKFTKWDGRGNNYFFCFSRPPANEHSFSSSRFLPLIFIRSICNYQTDSWWDLFSLDICILFAFLWMQLNRSLTFQSDIVRIWVHMKLSPFYFKGNMLTNWHLHSYPPLSIYHTYPALPLATTCSLTVSQNV